MTQKKLLMIRFEEICQALEKERGHYLTHEEANDAMRLLANEVYGESRFTSQDVEGLWEEVSTELASSAHITNDADAAYMVQIVKGHKKLLH